jgi:hypothetical protein
MVNRGIINKKLRAVLWAAIAGALLPILLTGGIELGGAQWGSEYHGKPSTDFWFGLACLTAVPAIYLQMISGILMSPYLVNAILGCAIFTIPTAFWQFVLKCDP